MRRPQENRVFILSGSRKEAEDWAHLNCLSREQFVLLVSPAQIAGLHDFKYVKVGTYYRRPLEERYEMMHWLTAHGALEITIP
jgi:hypothetical protein